MHRISVGVLGASGYAGRELCALVAEHPQFELVFATANASRGETMSLASGDVTFVATEDAPRTITHSCTASEPMTMKWNVTFTDADGVKAHALSTVHCQPKV